MQKITIIGNIGRAAEVKEVSGYQVAEWSIAVNTKGREGKVTTWWNCSLWGDRAAKVAPYLTRGTKVFVSGIYSDLIGTQGTIVRKCKVEDLEFCSPAQQQPQVQDQQPQPSYAPRQRSTGGSLSLKSMQDDGNSDLPF